MLRLDGGRHKICAIIAAGGSGKRFGGATLPKQFLQLNGRPIFVHSVATLISHSEIASVLIVVSPDMRERVRSDLNQYIGDAKKSIEICDGGNTRQESVHAALEYLARSSSDPPAYVLVHDAARPFVSTSDIDSLLIVLAEREFCTLAIPVADTLKKVEGEKIVATVDRSDLYAVQTPQAANFKLLLEAHRQARSEGYETTDDVALLERQKISVTVVPGSSTNFKITNPHDMQLACAVAAMRASEDERQSNV